MGVVTAGFVQDAMATCAAQGHKGIRSNVFPTGYTWYEPGCQFSGQNYNRTYMAVAIDLAVSLSVSEMFGLHLSVIELCCRYPYLGT